MMTSEQMAAALAELDNDSSDEEQENVEPSCETKQGDTNAQENQELEWWASDGGRGSLPEDAGITYVLEPSPPLDQSRKITLAEYGRSAPVAASSDVEECMLSRDELKNIDIPELETLQQQIIAKIGNEEGEGGSSKSESELQKYSKMIKGVILQKGTVDKQKERDAENKKKDELLQTTSLRGGPGWQSRGRVQYRRSGHQAAAITALTAAEPTLPTIKAGGDEFLKVYGASFSNFAAFSACKDIHFHLYRDGAGIRFRFNDGSELQFNDGDIANRDGVVLKPDPTTVIKVAGTSLANMVKQVKALANRSTISYSFKNTQVSKAILSLSDQQLGDFLELLERYVLVASNASPTKPAKVNGGGIKTRKRKRKGGKKKTRKKKKKRKTRKKTKRKKTTRKGGNGTRKKS